MTDDASLFCSEHPISSFTCHPTECYSYSFSGECIAPNVTNGFVEEVSNTNRMLVAKVTCNPDFVLVGKSLIKCRDGIWSASTPVCTSK